MYDYISSKEQSKFLNLFIFLVIFVKLFWVKGAMIFIRPILV